jgi:alginate O-acetyltransferase complex protein AlgI
LTVHFGWSNILSGLLRFSGRPVELLFDRPLASQSVAEFWSKRWNRPFIDMDRILFMKPLTRVLGLRGAVFAVFLISGILHELAISYPAGAGWGLPFLYFALQGALTLVEKRLRIRSRLWAFLGVFAPMPLLFHQPFRDAFVVPLLRNLHGVLASRPMTWYLDWAIWLIAAMQLLVLAASYQVPAALGWKEDLPKLRPFNRKLMWVYGWFTVYTIVGFGVLTFFLHDSLLRGDRAAGALAAFISIFWILRLVTDSAYFRSEDWPKGEKYVIGHAFLNLLFAALAVSYGALAIMSAVV